ncbi:MULTISPECIES: RnfH family protein [unclassified Pseudomonas]|uniref:RnfH family protein n=1 Tax=unclassified Pseudomonas TaxID=196821 RepID=UPI000D384AE7|nr:MULTISPECIES: RnfH family protein [unclassified Pseudomonas]RAU44850.1 RnfH family protein [Pseudomonas sp. RIT 409]RAU53578.1 RnfH family protein [Pseudomonas sp. RIT 412]
MAEPLMRVEVVYATPEHQTLLAVDVPVGATVSAAVDASGIARTIPGLDMTRCTLGVFGKVIAHPQERILNAGDRVEIYRPLLADPKAVRRLRAEKAAKAKRQAKSI